MTDKPLMEAVLEYYGADLSRVSETGWRALRCPFHADRLASASVHLGKGAFRCHACGVKGDAISLIKDREGLDFNGALNFTAEVFGQRVEGVRHTTRKDKPRSVSRWRDRLFA